MFSRLRFRRPLGFTDWFSLHKLGVWLVASLLSLSITHAVQAAPAQFPLFLSNPVVPIMMLNMSKDHQLYFKVYDDYSDLDGGGPDTTYKNGYDYYGYFDSEKCYTYSTTNNRFVPSRVVNSEGYCNFGGVSNEWSGNFLNWASMTRMDSIRKILYGGLRSTDTADTTVLERAFLPYDAHAFAKYYNGTDLHRLTPFDATQAPVGLTNTAETGITICNATPPGLPRPADPPGDEPQPAGPDILSQDVTHAPLLRIARGNYMFWASNERWQCRWQSDIAAGNGNTPGATRVYAYPDSPVDAHKLGTGSASGEYYARVQVCVSGLEESNCHTYPSRNRKPQGLLQEFGEIRDGATAPKINFGLMTGSYTRNKSGGVLRKTVGDMSSEVNSATDGTFTGTLRDDGTFIPTPGIISTLNRFRIYGYRYDNGTYHEGSPRNDDDCSWNLNSFENGQCSNWGNPQAEIYLESLRYLAGMAAPTPSFVTVDATTGAINNDSVKMSGLSSPSWGAAPITEANACAPLSVLQFNASVVSYDSDDLGTASDIMGSSNLSEWTNLIGAPNRENLSTTTSYFTGATRTVVGTTATGVAADGVCSAKPFTTLSAVRGTCPDAPRLEGSYHLAGLAYYARTNDFISSLAGIQTVRTYGVALSPALPKIEVPVPGSSPVRYVTIQPACRSTIIGTAPNNGACAIVDFKILSQSSDGTTNEGRLYVNWEDSEQGGDYDQDFWGIIDYAVTSSRVTIGTDVIDSSIGAGQPMGFGYVIGGTTSDGPHFHSGVGNFNQYECAITPTRLTNCNQGDALSQQVWTIGGSGGSFLESPLYYAAKWGGFSESLVRTTVGDQNYVAQNRLGYYARPDVLTAIGASTPETYYFATDPRKLEASLRSAFTSVAASIGSASAVATNSTRVSEGAFVFQAQFNTVNWTGAVNAYEFRTDGTLPTDPTFSTNFLGSMPRNGVGRSVYVLNGSDLRPLSWDNLTPAQRLALRFNGETTDVNAQQRVDWLRGNATYETDAAGLRSRGTGNNRVILGDIVNSSPAYVGAWDFRHNRLPQGGATYAAYVEAKKERPPLLVVGANDGMVHVFQAPTNDTRITNGRVLRELYAYIPTAVFPKLKNLSRPNYGKTENPHQFLVDGPITVGDVYINNRWRTIAVGTLGAGGRGIYALDVTETDNPSVLWELTELDYPALGFVMGKPLIAPMKNGRWAVVMGNGSESGQNSTLLVIDVENPRSTTLSRSLTAPAGVGLSAPELLPNGLGQIEAAYAGDLSGNLWRFDLSSTNSTNWEVDYLLFRAVDNTGDAQPIHSAPTLGLNPVKQNRVMVYFGTGKYFDQGDNSVSAALQHSFYAVADTGEEVERSDLFVKTLETDYSARTRAVVQDASTPAESPEWETQSGWRLDFSDTPGERVTTKALLLQDRLIFPTLIPSASACEYGGRSWLMEVCAVGTSCRAGSRTTTNRLNDYLLLGDVGIVRVPESGTSSSAGSSTSSASSSSASDDCGNASTGQAAVIGSGTNAALMNAGTTYNKCGEGRQSWRQLQ